MVSTPHLPDDLEASRSLAEPSRLPESVLAVLRVLADADHLSRTFAQPAARLFLSVKEAAKLSGLTERYIRELLESGELKAVRDGRRLRIRRRDLEGI